MLKTRIRRNIYRIARLPKKIFTKNFTSCSAWSDEQFFKQIDWPNEPGDYPALVSDRSNFIQSKKSPTDNGDIYSADRIIEGKFNLGDEAEVNFVDGIDWNFDPTSDPRKRWNRELHRFNWLIPLCAAYNESSDDKYVKFASCWIEDWIAKNPPPTQPQESNPVWTLMGVGLRADNWVKAATSWSEEPAFRSILPSLMRSFHDHAEFLSRYHTHGNHLLRESNGLANLAGTFPFFKSASKWKEIALCRLDREYQSQLNKDGSHYELSTGYHWMVIEELNKTSSLQKNFNWLLPDCNAEQKLEKAFHFLTYIVRPDFTWPQLNDGFFDSNENQLSEFAKASERFDRKDLLWVASRGKRGTKPAETSSSFPQAGLHVMRSNWANDANYLLFDTGAFGGMHGHEDMLSIEIAANGHNILVDPGTFTYNAQDPFRAYFASSHSHNTLSVDGMSQVRRWQTAHQSPESNVNSNARWRSSESFDFAAGVYRDGYAKYAFREPAYSEIHHQISHSRFVLFVKPNYWLIGDLVLSPETLSTERHFQCATNSRITRETYGFRIQRLGGELLLLDPDASTQSVSIFSGSDEPISGWISNGLRNHKEAAPMLRFQSQSNQAQYTVAYAAKPRGEKILNVSRTSSEEGDLVSISFDNRRLEQILIPPFRQSQSLSNSRATNGIRINQVSPDGETLEVIDVEESGFLVG